MASGDIIEVGFVVNVSGEETATVMHCRQNTGNPYSVNLADSIYAAMVAEGIIAAWEARTSHDAYFHCLKAQIIKPTRSAAVWYANNVPGTLAVDSLPASVSSLHHWQAPPYQETNKGQHFWSGVPKTLVALNRFTTAGLLLEGAFGETFQDVMTSDNDYEWGVYSRKLETFEALGIVSPRIVLRAVRSRKIKACL